MKYFIYILLGSFMLGSCTSETEQKALTKIAEIYGGNVNFTKGYSSSTDEGNQKYAEVTIENPQLFDEELNHKGLAAGCALLIHNHLTAEEQNSYDVYKIVFKNGSNEQIYSVGKEMVIQFSEYQKEVNKFITDATKGNLEEIHSRIPDFYNVPFDSLVSMFKPLKEVYGPLIEINNAEAISEEYETEGESKIKLMVYRGSLKMESGKVHYIIAIDPKNNKQNLYTIRFTYPH